MEFADLEKIELQAKKTLIQVKDLKSLYDLEVRFLGRKGSLTVLFSQLKDLSADEKKIFGQKCNELKKKLEDLFGKKRGELENESLNKNLAEDFDITLPGKKHEIGHIHPVAQVQYEVEQIFSDMGFEIADGPEVESEYYNFEGLNIPSWHPSRDMQDTFFIKGSSDKKHGRLVLRTHTSPVQIRIMEKYGAPLRIIVPGRVFRNEATDSRHEHTFDQVEGLLIDEYISLAHLKGVMEEFLTRLFERKMKVRFRPGYFPFVEPGLELDISCTLCDSRQTGEPEGCRICKYTGWLEFMGAGMVHPNVQNAGGINPKKYQGWAFGFGLTRLTMMKFGIDDIRLLLSGEFRFLQQF